jgi:DNA-binding transcriptional LysR family regulator
MNISLRLLRYVVAAADCRNVTEAARRLQVSQPSVSAAIAELEAMLGVIIFVRHHAKGVTLTPAGQRLINEARLLLKHAEDFTKAAEALGDTAKGEIAIGCFSTLAARFMPQLMLEFSAKHPQIIIRLTEGNQQGLINDLSQGRIEVAISYDLGIPSSFDVSPLLTLYPVVALAKNHPLAKNPDVSLKELQDDSLILYDDQPFIDYFMTLFKAADAKPSIGWRVQSFELIRGLVARGHGYAIHSIIPLSTTTYDGGELVMKPIRDAIQPARAVCITPGSHLLRPAVGIFCEFLQTALQSEHFGSEYTKSLSLARA